MENKVDATCHGFLGSGTGGETAISFHSLIQHFLQFVQLVHGFNGGQGLHGNGAQGGDYLLGGQVHHADLVFRLFLCRRSGHDALTFQLGENFPCAGDDRYWSASIVDGQIIAISPLTYSEARNWVDSGGSLLCINHAAAIGIVKFYPSARWDRAHKYGCGYLNHYHLSSAHTNHIWYYGE